VVVAGPATEHDSAEPLVRVQLLGRFAIYVGDKSAGRWPRLSARRLLALVFLSPQRRISRDVACDTLFRDLDSRAAAGALYNAVSSARGVLAGLGEPATAVLGTDRAGIYIPPTAAVEVDLDLHEEALGAALRMEPGATRDEALARALSEQGILLEDELYADWSVRRRDRLELSRQGARVALARDRSLGYGCSGPDGVIEAWEAVFSHDPACEEAAAALVGAYASRGERQRAVRTYNRCLAGLEDLGLEPSPALARAYRSARQEAGDPTDRSGSAWLGWPGPAHPPHLSTNLPTPPSSFIGREAEQAEVSSLVTSSALVTVTGPGGSGKTRLAIAVAAGLLAKGHVGASLVELAPIADQTQVPTALAAALGVREQVSRALSDVLADALSGQDLLVVIDNCEHVIDAAAELVVMLNRKCPRLRVLATSREPLGVDGERVFRLGPLSLPSAEARSVKDLEGSEAVQLFAERARAHDSTFCLEDSTAALVALVCRRLDGIPLALELAAARVASMSLAHIEERLTQGFRLLTGGSRTALPRQRTLQATIDWSFDLLPPPEQTVLGRLSVFSGSFELEGAEAVCTTETVATSEIAGLLGALVDKSLVIAERSLGSVRYSLLETIRHYGMERLLASAGETEWRRSTAAHANFYLGLSERAAPELRGRDQGHWLRRLDLDWGNLRAAVGYFLAEPGRTREVLRMGAALYYFFWTRCQRYGLEAVRSALARPDPVPAAERARAICLLSVAWASSLGWDSEKERRIASAWQYEGLELARDVGDQALTSYQLICIAWVLESLGEHAEASKCAEEGFERARGLGDPWLEGAALGALGTVATKPEQKRAFWQEGATYLRRAGDLALCSVCLSSRAVLELEEEHFDQAAALLEEAIELCEEIGAPLHLYWAWGALGEARLLEERYEDAAVCSTKALIGFRRLGLRDLAVSRLIDVACCATYLGKPAEATRLAGAYEGMHSPYLRQAGIPGRSNRFQRLALIEEKLRAGNCERLRQVLGDDDFNRNYSAGVRLTFDEAVDLALCVSV
jgi:predicted ATPase/DNA-binding SARP family transcriptional activator